MVFQHLTRDENKALLLYRLCVADSPSPTLSPMQIPTIKTVSIVTKPKMPSLAKKHMTSKFRISISFFVSDTFSLSCKNLKQHILFVPGSDIKYHGWLSRINREWSTTRNFIRIYIMPSRVEFIVSSC